MVDLYATIWKVSGRQQILLIVLAVCVAALASVPLEFQKRIVNGLTGDLTVWTLALNCGGMMGVILLSLGLKWVLGLRSNLTGEWVIRLIRSRIVERNREMAEGPHGHAVQSGTLATMISAEAEDLGKFTGNAFAEPLLQLGTLVSVLAFIAASEPLLGLLAAAVIVPQGLIAIYTQKRVNELVADRVRLLRSSSDDAVHALSTEKVNAVIASFGEIYDIRYKVFVWKLTTKFIISALNGIGTVGVLLLGGYMTLEGRSDVGTVVAATVGLSRLQAPWTLLIAFYRQASPMHVRLQLLREAFDRSF